MASHRIEANEATSTVKLSEDRPIARLSDASQYPTWTKRWISRLAKRYGGDKYILHIDDPHPISTGVLSVGTPTAASLLAAIGDTDGLAALHQQRAVSSAPTQNPTLASIVQEANPAAPTTFIERRRRAILNDAAGWHKTETAILDDLTQSLSTTLLQMLSDSETASANNLWQALRKMFSSQDEDAQTDALASFCGPHASLFPKNGSQEDFALFLRDAEAALNSYRCHGGILNDKVAFQHFMARLEPNRSDNNSWYQKLSSWQHRQDPDDLSFANAKAYLIRKGALRLSEPTPTTRRGSNNLPRTRARGGGGGGALALTAQHTAGRRRPSRRGKSRPTSRQPASRADDEEVICYYCGISGHIRPDCRSLARDKANRKVHPDVLPRSSSARKQLSQSAGSRRSVHQQANKYGNCEQADIAHEDDRTVHFLGDDDTVGDDSAQTEQSDDAFMALAAPLLTPEPLPNIPVSLQHPDPTAHCAAVTEEKTQCWSLQLHYPYLSRPCTI